MHPGWAASSAITAAAFADRDFAAPMHAYEGRYGLYNLYLRSMPNDVASIASDLGRQWEMMRVAIKPFPVCHFNHGCIDSMLAVTREHNLAPDEIESATVMLHEKVHDVVCQPEAAKRRPKNDYDAKFSVHFAVSAAAARGQFTLAELEDDALNDPTILSLCDRVTFEHWPESRHPDYFSGGIVVNTRDGRRLEHLEPENRGADTRPLSHDDVKAKFIGNVERAIDAEQAERVWSAVMTLDTADSLAALTDSVAV